MCGSRTKPRSGSIEICDGARLAPVSKLSGPPLARACHRHFLVRSEGCALWEQNRKHAPFAIPTAHADCAPQAVEQLARDAQTESRATELPRPRLIDLTKVFPNGLQILLPYADARIDNVDAHAIAHIGAAGNDGDAAAAGELHRV